jgi:hypothetical protein
MILVYTLVRTKQDLESMYGYVVVPGGYHVII